MLSSSLFPPPLCFPVPTFLDSVGPLLSSRRVITWTHDESSLQDQPRFFYCTVWPTQRELVVSNCMPPLWCAPSRPARTRVIWRPRPQSCQPALGANTQRRGSYSVPDLDVKVEGILQPDVVPKFEPRQPGRLENSTGLVSVF